MMITIQSTGRWFEREYRARCLLARNAAGGHESVNCDENDI